MHSERPHQLAAAIVLCLLQSFITSCGCSKAPSDRPMTLEKLRTYLPATIGKMAKKNSAKHDAEKDDFTVVFSDYQNEKYDTLHLEIRDQAEDAFGERFRADNNKKWRKITYRGCQGRELIVTASPGTNPPAATGKQSIEIMVGLRFFVGVTTDDEKTRAVWIKSLREILDAVDLQNLEAGKPPVKQAPSSMSSVPVPAATPGASASPGAVVASSGADDCPPLPPHPPHPTGVPNWFTKRVELALAKMEDQEPVDYAELCKLEKQLKNSGASGNKGLAASLEAKRKKFAELQGKIKDARKDLTDGYLHPPKDPNAPEPPPPPPKPKEPTLREKWTAKVEPMLKAATPEQGQAVIDEITKLPLEEKQTIEYHSALARAAQLVQSQEMAAEALLMLSVLLNDPRPESKRTEVQPVRAWLKKKTDMEFMVAMAGAKSPRPDQRKQAVIAYLKAVKLDAAVLARDDKGLRDLSLKVLRQQCEKPGVKPDFLFLLGVYAERLGESPQATSSFRSYVEKVTDPYLKWRGEAYLRKLSSSN